MAMLAGLLPTATAKQRLQFGPTQAWWLLLMLLLLWTGPGGIIVKGQQEDLMIPDSSADTTIYHDPPSYFGGTNNLSYLKWVSEADTSSQPYTNSFFMSSVVDPNLGVAVQYRIDETSRRIYLGLAVRATGWLGFGIAEVGGMLGADMLIFESAHPDVVLDAHVLDVRVPVMDECQDWVLTSSQVDVDDGLMMIHVHRALDTGDFQDRRIVNDLSDAVIPHTLIAAWGDDVAHAYHGTVNRAQASVRWYREEPDSSVSFREGVSQAGTRAFALQFANFTIPASETTYQRFCFSRDDLLAQGVPLDEFESLSIIAVAPYIDPGSVKFVHHLILYGGVASDFVDRESCLALQMLYGYAPGTEALLMPENVGIPLGPGDGGFDVFRLEIHYNNPDLIEDVVDTSGAILYYTTETRAQQAVMFPVGDPLVALEGQPVGDGLQEHTFTCSSECSAFVLKEEVTVFRTSLHMHQSGVSMHFEHIRDGEVINRADVQYFDFWQKGSPIVQMEAFTVKPGDSFRTVCQYEANNNEVFGIGSQEEMCVAFLMYYPRQTMFGSIGWACSYDLPIQACAANHTSRSLSSVSDLERSFGTQVALSDGAQCAISFAEEGTVLPFADDATVPPGSSSSEADENGGVRLTSGTDGRSQSREKFWTQILLSSVLLGLFSSS